MKIDKEDCPVEMQHCFTGPSAPTARSDSIPLTDRARLTLLPLCSTSLRGSENESQNENHWLQNISMLVKICL